jgi:hypothetical protein
VLLTLRRGKAAKGSKRRTSSWEFPRPWRVVDDDPDPGPPGCASSIWWPKLLALRAALKAAVLAQLVHSQGTGGRLRSFSFGASVALK